MIKMLLMKLCGYGELLAERDELLAERDELLAERDELLAEANDLSVCFAAIEHSQKIRRLAGNPPQTPQ